MNRDLTISVCLASYNGEEYIRDQLLSILTQLDECDEIIVSDDDSSDRTVEIVKEMQRECPIIKIIPGPKMGFSCNFGNAAFHAKKDIVLYSDQDDLWTPDKVETIISCFKNHSECTTILHNMSTFSENPETDTNLFPISHHKGVLRNFIKSSYWGCCMAVRREFLNRFLPFRDYCVGHDQLTGLMSEKYGKVVFIDKKMIYHRVHGDNTSLKRKTIPEMIIFRKELYKDYRFASRKYKESLKRNIK